MNPYQRIIKDGAVLQPGHIDTQVKFQQLVDGIDLNGLRILDVGCNLGEMSRLAKAAGAHRVCGIDINPEYIADARRLSTGIEGLWFDVQRAERASRSWDLVIASAVLHHSGLNMDATLAQFARITPRVVCDVLMSKLDDNTAAWRYDFKRELFTPNMAAFLTVALKHFGKVRPRGQALSPDGSNRVLFTLEEPKPKPAPALILYGNSRTGKTSKAKELERGLGYEHLQLDQIFIEWRITQERSSVLSVSDFVDDVWSNEWVPVRPGVTADTNVGQESDRSERCKRYLSYHESYLWRWLDARVNLPVVIEGYDPVYAPYRKMLVRCLEKSGWAASVIETECL